MFWAIRNFQRQPYISLKFPAKVFASTLLHRHICVFFPFANFWSADVIFAKIVQNAFLWWQFLVCAISYVCSIFGLFGPKKSMSEMFRTSVSSNLVCVFQTWRDRKILYWSHEEFGDTIWLCGLLSKFYGNHPTSAKTCSTFCRYVIIRTFSWCLLRPGSYITVFDFKWVLSRHWLRN